MLGLALPLGGRLDWPEKLPRSRSACLPGPPAWVPLRQLASLTLQPLTQMDQQQPNHSSHCTLTQPKRRARTVVTVHGRQPQRDARGYASRLQ